MRKFITLFAIALSLTACKQSTQQNQETIQGGKKILYKNGDSEISVGGGETTKPKFRLDSSYAAYRLGNSLEVFNSKVYIGYTDTSLMVPVDSVTIRKVDTTIKTYFIPQIDTLFQDQAKRDKPLIDEATKKPKRGINWLPIDQRYILQDYKMNK